MIMPSVPTSMMDVFRVCSPKNLTDESSHIEDSFLNHLYLKPLIIFAKSKALNIHNRNRSWTAINTPSDKDKIRLPYKHIILANNSSTYIIGNHLNKLGITKKKTFLFSKTIRYLLHSSSQRDIISEVNVYCITYKDSKLKFMGETVRNNQKHKYEHKRNIRLGNLNNALLLNISKTDHNFDFYEATTLANI